MNLDNLFELDTNMRLRTYWGYPTFYTTNWDLPCTRNSQNGGPRVLENCCNDKCIRDFDYQYL